MLNFITRFSLELSGQRVFLCGSASVCHTNDAFMGTWVCNFSTSAKLQDSVQSALLLQTVGDPDGSST